MKTSIIILTHNNLEYTKMCVESIRKYTRRGTYEIIVVDNHSVDGTVEWLKDQEDIKYITNWENFGYPIGCNQGIKIATGDNILLLNNDTIVTHNWLDNLIQCLYSADDIGAVGPVTNHASYYQSIPTNYQNIEQMHEFAKNYNISDKSKWDERIKLVGFCILIKREVVEQVGPLDELFTPGNYEDDDYSFRILQAGYKLMLCKDTFIHHFGSLSFRENIPEFRRLLKTNEEKFTNKWGFDPIYSTYIRFDLINLIDSPTDEVINVLDVGYGCGATLLQIKNQYKNANLYGIELNEKAGSIASLFANVLIGNIEEMELNYPDEFFDYIIFGDVLEHLYNPWEVVRRMRKYLKPDGKIIVSIPNVMHFSLIKHLINGYWTYADSGLLDRTHIRFFTLHEVVKMFLEAGYQKVEYAMNVVFKTEEDEEFIRRLGHISNNFDYNQFNAYQYILKVYKIDPNRLNKCDEPLLFLLRHVEDKLDLDPNLGKIVDLLSDGFIECEQIISLVSERLIKKIEVLNLIAMECYRKGQYDFIIPLLQAAYKLDHNHPDTLYNLGYFLHKLGENELAKSFLEKIIFKDKEVLELIGEINGIKVK